MYMPDPQLAKQVVECPPFGRLLRFDVYGLALHRPDDPYNAVVRRLQEEGMHRNVFLVDQNNAPLWRVADYWQSETESDMFVDIRCSEQPGYAEGVTGSGHIFKITLADGSLEKIGWTK